MGTSQNWNSPSYLTPLSIKLIHGSCNVIVSRNCFVQVGCLSVLCTYAFGENLSYVILRPRMDAGEARCTFPFSSNLDKVNLNIKWNVFWVKYTCVLVTLCEFSFTYLNNISEILQYKTIFLMYYDKSNRKVIYYYKIKSFMFISVVLMDVSLRYIVKLQVCFK